MYTPHPLRSMEALGVRGWETFFETDLLLDDEDLRRAEIRDEDLLVPFDLESLVPPRSDVSVSPTAMIAYGKGKYTWVLLGVRGVGWFTTGQTSWSGGGTGKALNWHMVLDLIEDADWVFEVIRDAPITDLAEWHEELGDGFD